MKPRLVLACQVAPDVAARARGEYDLLAAEGDHDWMTEEALAAVAAHRADALMLTVNTKMPAAAMARLPDSVRVIASSSVGHDHLDVAAARARGIVVTNTPGVLSDCTADLAFMLLLCACRRAHEYDAMMRAGWRTWLRQGEMLGLRASGRTLGILGMGSIGQAVARRARGFGMPVLYHNRRRLPPEQEQGAMYFADFRAMLARCQSLTLHAPSNAETAGIINAETLALLPRGAVLVNTSRGGLVDEDALFDALKSGHLGAAGLDVFRSEPDYDTRFAELPNVFLTPHMASATQETRNAMGFKALDNIAAVLAGRPPLDPL